MPARSIKLVLLPLAMIALPLRSNAATIHSFHSADTCPMDCGFGGVDLTGPIPSNWIGSDLHLIMAPLPSTWTMMLIGLVMAFAAYRIFSVPD
jgi:uncharacterized membrane protein